jgi:hypothetical protein
MPETNATSGEASAPDSAAGDRAGAPARQAFVLALGGGRAADLHLTSREA